MLKFSLTLTAMALVLSACAPQSPDAPQANVPTPSGKITAASVTYDDASMVYTLAWEEQDGDLAVDVVMLNDPAASDGQVIAKAVRENQLTWSSETGDKTRHYFKLRPETGESVVTATRLLPLEGGRNFRDLGGYTTEDGRTVKWGKVYRSGVMDDLTDNDYDYLKDLGIKVVCDFRESDERLREPTEWGAGAIDYLTFADPVAEGDPRDNPMFAALMSPQTTPEDVAQGMANAYFDLAMNEREGYTAMFDRLAAGEMPLAFNCSAGKDRAGTAAALILTALGVPRETVVYDYSLSDTYVDYMEEFAGEEAREAAANDPENPYAFLMRLPPEKLAPLMASDPRYIEASFAEMEDRYGSVMGFITTELDVTEQDLKAIRASLLE